MTHTVKPSGLLFREKETNLQLGDPKTWWYMTPENYTKASPFKLRRGPFRAIPNEGIATLNIGATHLVVSGRGREEAWCGSLATAEFVVQKWNEEAALLLMVEGTKAEELIDI